MTYDEGLCVQSMHIGSYDDELGTFAIMHVYMESQGYTLDIPADIMNKLLTGEYCRIGGAVRYAIGPKRRKR